MHLQLPFKELAISAFIVVVLWLALPVTLWWVQESNLNKSGVAADTFGIANTLFSGLTLAAAIVVIRTQRQAEVRERTIRFFERVTDPSAVRKFSYFFERPFESGSVEGIEEMKFLLVNFAAVLGSDELDLPLAKSLLQGPITAWLTGIAMAEQKWDARLEAPRELADVKQVLQALANHLKIQAPLTNLDR